MSLNSEIQRTNTVLSALTSALSAIKSKITSKGGTIGASDGFSDVADAIDTIPSGGTTPTKGFVPTAWDSNGVITDGEIYGEPYEYMFAKTKSSSRYDPSVFNLENVTFKDNILTISARCFYYNSKLKIEIPNSVTSIGDYAYYQCKLRNKQNRTLIIPESVNKIGKYSFGYSVSGTDIVKFFGTPQSIASDAFYENSAYASPADFYVPWDEGEVPGAPWGFASSNIHYSWTPTE